MTKVSIAAGAAGQGIHGALAGEPGGDMVPKAGWSPETREGHGPFLGIR